MRKILTFLTSFGLLAGIAVAPAFAITYPTCTVPGDYLKIQDAVNDSGCTTINVAAETYAENVTINHAVVLNGPNVGVVGNGSRVPEADVQQVNITASNVTVDGFGFTNPGTQMNINGTTTLSGVKVQNNIFSGYSSVGFPTFNAGNLLITRNLFQTPATSSEAIQVKADGSTTGGCNGTEVSDNVFTAASNNGGADVNFSCTGSNSTGVTVSGNTDTGLNDVNGTSFTAFSGVTGDISVMDNKVTGTAKSGSAVFFFGSVSGTASITGNKIVDGAGSAVSIHGGEYTSDTPNTGTFTITNNDLSGNGRGVYVSNVALGSGAKVITNRNDLSGDTTYGVDNETTSAIIADGTCNWWGDASGPGSVASGTGSKVSTNVTYTPWLFSSDLNGSCSGVLAHGTITSPANDGDHVSGTLNLAATYDDGDVPNTDDAVQWAVRQGTCDVGTNTVLGNVDGHSDVASWDGNNFSFSTDVSSFTPGNYCFVFNPTDDSGQPDIRLTRNFVIDAPVVTVGPPTYFAQCRDNGWKTFNNPTFRNEGLCIAYVARHLHRTEGSIKYTAYSLNRHAQWGIANIGNNPMGAVGAYGYTDANHNWYVVSAKDLHASGNKAWFAGPVTSASNHSWIGQWLFAEVEDNSPDMIWGSFTNQSTAETGVMNMTSPSDGPFNVTSGNLNVH